MTEQLSAAEYTRIAIMRLNAELQLVRWQEVPGAPENAYELAVLVAAATEIRMRREWEHEVLALEGELRLQVAAWRRRVKSAGRVKRKRARREKRIGRRR